MAEPNYGAAAQQTSLMLQKVNDDVRTSENLEYCLDKQFSDLPADEIGLQAYRHPIQTEVGGIGGYYQPDGGSYPQGNGPQYNQFVVAPQPIIVAFAATELARRISAGGRDVVVDNWIARMIADAKKKAARYRNTYLQGYNNGILAQISATWGGAGTVVPLNNLPFGGRLLNLGDSLQVTDTAFNVIGTANVLDLSKNSVGAGDTVTVDAMPGGSAANYYFLPFGLASGTPIAIQGLQYIISPSTALEYCGVARSNSYVQSPAYNANSAFLTLGVTEAFKTRMMQALGNEQFQAQRKSNIWYGHGAHIMSANVLGFAKTTYMQGQGKLPGQNYDIGIDPFGNNMLAGMPYYPDSTAAIDKIYWFDKGTLKRVRYPGSMKFIPGPVEGMFWPRISGGLYQSESDVLFQDSVNYYSNLPWGNGVIYGLGIQPSLSN